MDVFFPENHTPADKRGCIVFFFGGGSAGGHVAAACAMCPKIDATPDSPVSCMPNALVLCNPVYEGEEHGFFHISKGGRKMFEDVLTKTDAFLVKNGYLTGKDNLTEWTSQAIKPFNKISAVAVALFAFGVEEIERRFNIRRRQVRHPESYLLSQRPGDQRPSSQT